MAAVLADIGGTYARVAVLGPGGIGDIVKKECDKFPGLPELLVSCGVPPGPLYLATAAWPDTSGQWRFSRPGHWLIDCSALEKQGWALRWIGNDFGAGARGAQALGPEGLVTVQSAGVNATTPQPRIAVLGSGTGLGLAYVCDGVVHETYGGQMEAPQRTDEQHTIISLITRLMDDGRTVTAEDILSGPGLTLLYKASCLMHGLRLDDVDPQAILAAPGEFIHSHVLRLFHEFLGLFAHQAVLYGHALGGLFLDGGIIHRLVENNAFDRDSFLQYLVGEPIPLVKTQLQAMPVHIVTDPYVALRGLAEMAACDA